MNDVVELYKKCRIQCFLTIGTESQDILVSATVSITHLPPPRMFSDPSLLVGLNSKII